jgi:hypothetical protein
MADRVLFISWGSPIPGREEHSLEVFNDAVGLYGRLQQEGKIESFDVVLLNAHSETNGYMELHGTHEQLDAVQENDEFRRTLIDAALVVEDLRVAEGVTNEGVARDMALYQEAIAKVPQSA